MSNFKVCMLSTSYICSKDDFSLHHDLAKRLAEKGIQVNVVCPHDEKQSKGFEEVDGVKIFRFQYFFPRSLQRLAYRGGIPHNLKHSFSAKLQLPFFAASFFLKSISCAKKADIIHAQFVLSGFVGVMLKKIFKKPLIVQVHESMLAGGAVRRLNKFVLNNSDFVVFNSSFTMHNAEKFCKLKASEVIHPSIDERLFFPSKQKSGIIRKKFSLLQKTKIVFSLGRLVEKKGFEYLIEAMSLLPKETEAVCVLGGFGPLEEKLKQEIKEKNLTDRFFLAGRIENKELPEWINDSDIFVVPSVYSGEETETFGIVAMEASACGKAVIASNIGGLTDIVEDKKTGLLVEEKNSKQIVEKIEFLLKNPKIAAELGKNARKKVEEKLAWSVAVRQVLEIYPKLLKK